MLLNYLYIYSDIYWTILHNAFNNRTQTHTKKENFFFFKFFAILAYFDSHFGFFSIRGYIFAIFYLILLKWSLNDVWQLRFKVMTTDFFLRNLSIIIFVRLAWTTPQNTIFEKKNGSNQSKRLRKV